MRYVKQAVILALSFALIFGVAACKKQEQPVVTPTPQTATATVKVEEATPEPTDAPTEAPEVYDPQGRDALNGDPVANTYRPIIVQIDNLNVARPQSGPQSADIVYEMQVEATITRLMAVFNSNIPDRVGPVRSARVYYLAIANEYDALYTHFGGTNTPGHPGNIYDYMPKVKIPFRIDGLAEHYGTISRDSSRKAPHNAYLNTEKARALYGDYQAEPRYFPFSENAVYDGAAEATEVTIPFNQRDSLVEYVYDAEKDVYLRSQGGKPFIDADTKEQVTVRNLIVEYAEYTPWPGTQEGHIIGSGKAQYFIHGKVIEGTWEKETIDSPTVFKDTDGKLVYLRPGNTWIHVPDISVAATWEK